MKSSWCMELVKFSRVEGRRRTIIASAKLQAMNFVGCQDGRKFREVDRWNYSSCCFLMGTRWENQKVFHSKPLTHKNHFYFAKHRPYSDSKARHSSSQINRRSSLQAIEFMADAILPASFHEKRLSLPFAFSGDVYSNWRHLQERFTQSKSVD